ncbi:MAG: hypothetical protein JWQ28_272, partial [Pedobacter sp.]|nr:hypothetical protein [Pedobacter sp.]
NLEERVANMPFILDAFMSKTFNQSQLKEAILNVFKKYDTAGN